MKKGFTLIELMIVVGILSILVLATVPSLLSTQNQVSVDSVATTILADLKGQQMKAMMGESPTLTTSDHGIYLETNQYTLFSGAVYNSLDPSNLTFAMETNINAGGTLPLQIVFLKRSGQIASPISFTLSHTSTGEQRSFNLNRFGSVTIN